MASRTSPGDALVLDPAGCRVARCAASSPPCWSSPHARCSPRPPVRLPRADQQDELRHPARARAQLGRPRLRLRLRVRAGQAVQVRRQDRDGQRAALALLRARRHVASAKGRDRTSTRTSSGSGSATERVVERLVAQRPPHGPKPEGARARRGYAAGYNAYLRKRGRAELPDPSCRGKAWVRPITALDLYRRYYQLGLLASGGQFLGDIVAAAPPAGRRAARAPPSVRPPLPTRFGARPARPSRSARTPYGARHRRRPRAARGWCSATRTSRGRAPSAGTSSSSPSPASWT